MIQTSTEIRDELLKKLYIKCVLELIHNDQLHYIPKYKNFVKDFEKMEKSDLLNGDITLLP